jgi:hypothetical protein
VSEAITGQPMPGEPSQRISPRPCSKATCWAARLSTTAKGRFKVRTISTANSRSCRPNGASSVTSNTRSLPRMLSITGQEVPGGLMASPRCNRPSMNRIGPAAPSRRSPIGFGTSRRASVGPASRQPPREWHNSANTSTCLPSQVVAP